MKKYIIIKNENDRYFFNKIKNYYPIYDMFLLLLENYKIIKFLPPINFSILGKWKYIIKKVDVVIIFDTMYYSKVSKYIKRKNSSCKTIMYFWNRIDNDKRKNILKDPNIDEFYTFDINDANKYHIKYNPQFYSNKMSINNLDIINDVFFFGRDKSRSKEILIIKDILNKYGLSTDISFLYDEYKFISYEDYLNKLSKSRVLLDYNQKNQVGLSMRCMDSLFFNKKLITNNKSIRKYDFYNPNNIFIIGIDNYKDIVKFINSDYVKVDDDIIKKYDISNWISHFLDN